MPVSSHALLQHVQDRTTDLCRWLDTGNNTSALTAYLRDEPVDHRWLTTYQRPTHDLLRAVDQPARPGRRTKRRRRRRTSAGPSVNDDQRRALGHDRETCAMLRGLLTIDPSDRPRNGLRSATFERLTDDLGFVVDERGTDGSLRGWRVERCLCPRITGWPGVRVAPGRPGPCAKRRIVQCELDHTTLSGARPHNPAEETDQWFGRPPGQGGGR
ncbi:hypothetical protein MLGJGCBP_05066 [Rhodococcus sp. T7]|nr:hypothetical protein MLGJGCBP_05066 [Rhodococcus sp. T7]